MTLALLLRAAALAASIAVSATPERPQAPTSPAPDPTVPPRDVSARGPAPMTPPTAVVRGRVVAADTGLPLRRATVSLRSVGEPQGLATTTDAEGVFVLDAVPKGRYRLKASKARYVDTALGARTVGGPGRAFEIGEGQKIENVTIGLALAGVITGRVLDDAGEPVAGVHVAALQRKRTEGRLQSIGSEYGYARSDDTGTFRIFGLPPGRYYLSASPNTRVPGDGMTNTSSTSLALTYYPSTPVASEAIAIDVAAAAEASADISLVATQVTTVSGAIVDAAGRVPVVGVLHVLPTGEDGSFSGPGAMAQVNKNGTFTLSGVAPGDYKLNVTAFFDEGELVRMMGRQSMDGDMFTMPLTVSGTPITDLRIVVTPPIEIAGRVAFEGQTPGVVPVPVTIFATASTGQNDGSATAPVGVDGRFSLRLRPGSWRISALAGRGWMPKRMVLRGRAVDLTAPVEIGGEPGARLDVLLTSQLTAVTGTASDATGAPLLDYHVAVFPADPKDRKFGRGLQIERPDAQGRFRVEALLPGDYFAVALTDDDAQESLDEDAIEALKPGATPVRIREGQTETITLKAAKQP